ncbi:glycoside hydrolase family 97 protein [Pedobacter gandavensis]|uniref:glycoside hydrolase family 97 protein n=1 Tax=Pedobacter gandavensis TaxID=2679963 RepID=UPI0029304AD3|nr:glycoside hydrolase family 97 N-terminal domain-containing protein [Pedobacter gandavensis]
MGFTLIAQAKEIKILSPDKKIELTISTNLRNEKRLSYTIAYKGIPVIASSPLGLEFEHEKPLAEDLSIHSVKEKHRKGTWKPVYGEKEFYLDHYNEVSIQFKEEKLPYRVFSITSRVYNEGAAFRYNMLTDKLVTVTKELTGFKFKADYPSWVAGAAQSKYRKASISQTGNGTERPYVIEMNSDCFVALGEAALVDHARMKFSPAPKDSLMLLTTLDGKSVYKDNFSTPWRYVMIAESAGKLLENNHFILNLNEANAIKDHSWIKPGKVIREVTLTTTGGKACIDFAARHNLQYVEFDAGWYGHEYDDAASALAVNVDPSRSPGPLALQEVIAYGKSKGVGILLYVNQRALSKQLDTILPLFKSWGVVGMKYGFVNVGSQISTSWLHEAVRKAADHQLMVDIHDEYRPTGYSRTYPNLLTQEGIRGEEERPDNQQVLTTMFTRMIAGAGDFTNCYFVPSVYEMGSHASQMAKAICIYSPWQFIYWYDRPLGSPIKKGGAGAWASVIEEIPDLSFYDALPTVWHDTKVINGKIGAFGTIARRSGENWFVGTLTDEAINFKLPLDFLEKKQQYEATVYTDDASLASPTKLAIKRMKVDASSILDIHLLEKNGQAFIIRPIK